MHVPYSSSHRVHFSHIRRVCEVKLLGNKKFVLRQQKYKVSDTLKTGEAVALFSTCSPGLISNPHGVIPPR